MTKIYVIDTNALISYFDKVFRAPNLLSGYTRKLMDFAFSSTEGNIKLSIPSVVFVEIFEKWFVNEEFARTFYYEVFEVIKLSPNIEIKPIEREVLENLAELRGSLQGHDVHDKLVLASAMMLKCPVITTDKTLENYIKLSKVVPMAIN